MHTLRGCSLHHTRPAFPCSLGTAGFARRQKRGHSSRHIVIKSVASSSSQGTSSGNQSTSSYRVSLFQAMKVFGPAPERINGRLAMLMFIPMVLREMRTSETILEQFSNPSYGYIAACLVLSYASMIPILKGAKDEDFGFMKVSVEKANGRVAMLAWLTILGLEYYAGACFF